MADSASYVYRRERATPPRSRGAQANEYVAASKPRGDTARKNSENIPRITDQAGQTTSELGNSLVGPGRRRVGLESHRPGRAWARDLENITSAGWARRRRLGPARPHFRGLAPPAKAVGLEIMDFLEFENITKRGIKRDISAIFVRNGMSWIVILCHAQMSRIVTFFFLVRNGLNS